MSAVVGPAAVAADDRMRLVHVHDYYGVLDLLTS